MILQKQQALQMNILEINYEFKVKNKSRHRRKT